MTTKLKKKTKFNPMQKVREHVEKERLMDKVTSDLEAQGAVIFKPQELGGTLDIDAEYIHIPSDLTEIESRDLGRHLNALTQQKAYMRTLYSWQEMETEEHKRKYYDEYSPIYTGLTSEHPKMTETSKDIICNNHGAVKDLFISYKDAKFKLSMLGSSLSSYEEMIFLVSREISRRGQDFNEGRRLENLR